MFNKTFNSFVDRGPSYSNVNATVTENRAPTDDSVRLMKEFEEAARNKITETTMVKNTEFTCKIHKMQDLMLGQDMYKVVYSLNGIRNHVDISVDTAEMLSAVEVACFIRDQVALDIANKMLSTAFRDEKHWEFFRAPK